MTGATQLKLRPPKGDEVRYLPPRCVMSMSNMLAPFSRRSFLQVSSAALACHILTEPMLAQVAIERNEYPKNAIRINSNENPLGPSTAARDAVLAVLPDGGRYQFHLTEKLVK